MSDRIDVSGTGTAQARPDRLVARLGAEGVGPDVAAALAAGEAAARAMTAAARSAGVGDGDLRTEDMSVGQHHDQQGQPSGYRAWLGLAVALRDVDGAVDRDSLVAAIERIDAMPSASGGQLRFRAGEHWGCRELRRIEWRDRAWRVLSDYQPIDCWLT